MTDAVSQEDLAHCQNLVRLYTRDQYLADLLLPPTLRSDLTVLHAFHAAIVEAINQVTEPMAGEIRLQWWRDVIKGDRAGEAAGHPVARSLLSVIEKHGLIIPGRNWWMGSPRYYQQADLVLILRGYILVLMV